MRRLLIQTSDTYAQWVGAVGAGLSCGSSGSEPTFLARAVFVCPGPKPTDGTGKNDPETLVVATGCDAPFADVLRA
jgi:hypothetical protein